MKLLFGIALFVIGGWVNFWGWYALMSQKLNWGLNKRIGAFVLVLLPSIVLFWWGTAFALGI